MDKDVFCKYYNINGIEDPNLLCQRYFTIIEIKKSHQEFKNVGQTIYLDVKLFCRYYVKSKLNKDFGYDEFEKCKMLSTISVLDIRKQYLILCYLERLMQKDGYSTDWIVLEKLKCSCLISKEEHHYFLACMLYCKLHLFATILAIVFVFLIWCIILSPAPCTSFCVFELCKVEYSSNSVLNHIANVLSLWLNFSNPAKLKCLSVWGVFLLGIFNLLYFVFCVNYLFKNLFCKIKVDDTKD